MTFHIVLLFVLWNFASFANCSDPACSKGVLDTKKENCCLKSCGRCGGSSCQSHPGGSKNCCSGTIATDGRSCQQYDAPCIMKPTPSPHPTPGGLVDLACELNGKFNHTTQKCLCRQGWTGNTCGLLDFAPAASKGGFNEVGYSAWGFTQPGPMPYKDGKYYAVVAFIRDHIGIDKYSKGMGLVMAVADNAEGPYTRMKLQMNETQFAPPYTGNPGAAYDKRSDTYVIFKQGCGGQPKHLTCGDVNAMTSSTPFGPWAHVGSVLNGTHRDDTWDKGDSNCVPFIDDDGVTWVMYRSHGYTSKEGHHYGEYLGLQKATTWRGPFSKVGGADAPPIIKESNEDPFMWRDKVTGMFHAITHTEVRIPQPPALAPMQLGSTVGGGSVGGRHIWSEDGSKWHSTTDHLALGEHVQLDNGTEWTLSRRERPFILFESDGSTPRVVFNGVELPWETPRVFVLAQPIRQQHSVLQAQSRKESTWI